MPEPTTETEDLCISCNMCCNGMIFAKVALKSAEIRRLGRGGRYFSEGKQEYMHQPCSFLGKNGACQVYECRPTKCDAFNCDLLDKVATGELKADYARQIITRAKAFQDLTVAACAQANLHPSDDRDYTDASDAFLSLVNDVAGTDAEYSPLFQEAVFHWNVSKHYMRQHFDQNYCPDPD